MRPTVTSQSLLCNHSHPSVLIRLGKLLSAVCTCAPHKHIKERWSPHIWCVDHLATCFSYTTSFGSDFRYTEKHHIFSFFNSDPRTKIMTMAVDNQQRFSGMNFDHMPYSNTPQFTNPWTSSAPAPQQSVYATSQQSHHISPPSINAIKPDPLPRLSNNNVGYAGIPVSATSGSPPLADLYGSQDLLTMTQDLLSPNRALPLGGFANQTTYTSAASPVHSNYAQSSAPFESMGYAPAPVRSTYALPHQQDTARRLSHPSATTYVDPLEDARQRSGSILEFTNRVVGGDSSRSYNDAIDASRGMIAMSQDQTTPRDIYGPRAGRGSADSYGFPSTHSNTSSISSSSQYPQYFGGSIDSSVSDYSNSDMESVSSRTLPRPTSLLTTGMPPAPQSMMGQFSSKVASSTQKKHKCKVCDKRFTRPSSLQTHMYSHTGEKRKFSNYAISVTPLTCFAAFQCEVEGCGRHFSVVSNLRRHRKVHKGDAQSEAGSEDHHSDD